VTTLEAELVQASGCKPFKKGGDRQDFLKRLAWKVNDLNDDAWKKMTDPAQEWQNEAMRAVEKKRPVTDFSDAEEEAEEAAAAETPAPPKAKVVAATKEKAVAKKHKDGNGKDKTVARVRAKETKPEKVVKAKLVVKAKAKPAKSGASVPHLIHRMIFKNPNMSAKALAEQLVKKGHEVSEPTINAIKYNTVTVLRHAQEEGVNLKALSL
jgi:hypothetical protein